MQIFMHLSLCYFCSDSHEIFTNLLNYEIGNDIHHFGKFLLVLYRSIIIDDQSKISFDSTNRLCLVIIDYNRKDSHLTLL